MELLSKYRAMARELPREAFVAQFPHPVLVKWADVNSPQPAPLDSAFQSTTRTLELCKDPMAAVGQVVEVKKRPGNPDPDRLSLGRSPSCDVVIRVPFVSKIHAHLYLHADGSLNLEDNSGKNGTYLDHYKLSPGEQLRVEYGDTISLGSLNLEVMDPASFYDMLLGKVQHPARA